MIVEKFKSNVTSILKGFVATTNHNMQLHEYESKKKITLLNSLESKAFAAKAPGYDDVRSI